MSVNAGLHESSTPHIKAPKTDEDFNKIGEDLIAINQESRTFIPGKLHQSDEEKSKVQIGSRRKGDELDSEPPHKKRTLKG